MGSLGARLKEIRLQRGLSQSALAAGLASKSMVSQIESGKGRPSRELLKRFAERLGIEMEELLPAMEDDQQRLAEFRQAQALHVLGHYEQALPLLQKCLQAPLATWSIRLLHMQTGCCCHAMKRYDEARRQYEAALREAVREQEQAEEVRLHHRLGEVAFACGDWSVALHEWQMAMRHLEGRDPPEDEPGLAWDLLLNLGKAHHRLGQFKQALRSYRKALCDMLDRKHPLRKEAEATFGIGISCLRRKRYRMAEEYLGRASEQYDLARDRRSALEVRLELARLLGEVGQGQRAMDVLETCAGIAAELGDAELGARIVCERTVIWQEQGMSGKAVEELMEALRRESKKSFSGKGVLHLRLADLHAEEQRFEAALLEAERAVSELSEEREKAELVKAYQLLTRLHKEMGDYKRASECVAKVNELMNQQIRGAGLLA